MNYACCSSSFANCVIGLPRDLTKQILAWSRSLIYPVSLKKDGQYKASSKVIRDEDLQLVLRMTDERFIQAAEEIQSGRIDLAPYKDNPYTTALQPGYRVISGFDATEHYHLYRRKTIKAKEVINQLKIDFEGKEEG